MAYINTQTLEYPLYEGDIKLLHPESNEVPNIYAFVNPTEEPELSIAKNIYERAPQNVDGAWYQVWEVQDATEEQIASRKQKLEHYKNNFLEIVTQDFK